MKIIDKVVGNDLNMTCANFQLIWGRGMGVAAIFRFWPFSLKSRVSGIFEAQDGLSFCISGSILPTKTVHHFLERGKYFMKDGHAHRGRGQHLWAWQIKFVLKFNF